MNRNHQLFICPITFEEGNHQVYWIIELFELEEKEKVN